MSRATTFRRLPIRVRITLAFSAAMGLLLTLIAIALYHNTSGALLEVLDTNLKQRAASVQSAVERGDLASVAPGLGLIERGEAYADVVNLQEGRAVSVLRKTRSVLPAATLRDVVRPAFFVRNIRGIQGRTRLLVLPVKGGSGQTYVLVGTFMQDLEDAKKVTALVLALGGPLALGLAALAGWLVAGAALRPVESMRLQAAAISVSGLDRRLTEPATNDEISRLAHTLNEMLAGLQESFVGERTFLDNASHELRTPLAILRAELSLALSRPRNFGELMDVLESASAEADRLSRLADDLLVLSRANRGRLQVNRGEVDLDVLVNEAVGRFRTGAEAGGIRLVVEAPPAKVLVDEMRLAQAIDNLLGNALRHTPSDGAVTVSATVEGNSMTLVVEDTGQGFPEGFDELAFEPFRKMDDEAGIGGGSGLGLSIVRAIAMGHGGKVLIENAPEAGARVTITCKAR